MDGVKVDKYHPQKIGGKVEKDYEAAVSIAAKALADEIDAMLIKQKMLIKTGKMKWKRL